VTTLEEHCIVKANPELNIMVVSVQIDKQGGLDAKMHVWISTTELC
jgi:hypothetical protein